jgi:hypothetical protein
MKYPIKINFLFLLFLKITSQSRQEGMQYPVGEKIDRHLPLQFIVF